MSSRTIHYAVQLYLPFHNFIILFITAVKKPLGVMQFFLKNTQNFTGYFWMNIVSYPCISNSSVVLTCHNCSNED